MADQGRRWQELRQRAASVPWHLEFAAALGVWLLLSGFIIVPAAFPAITHSQWLASKVTGEVIQHAVRSVPSLVVALLVFAAGVIVICCLWYHSHRQKNYLWLVNTLFM